MIAWLSLSLACLSMSARADEYSAFPDMPPMPRTYVLPECPVTVFTILYRASFRVTFVFQLSAFSGNRPVMPQLLSSAMRSAENAMPYDFFIIVKFFLNRYFCGP